MGEPVKVPYLDREGIADWLVDRIAYDLKDGETFASAVEAERKDFMEFLRSVVEDDAACSQDWHDVVKIMRQTAKEILDNATEWWEALDAEESRLFAATLPTSTPTPEAPQKAEAHPGEGRSG